MTWTTEHSATIVRELCGYGIETSPAGRVFCRSSDDELFPLPDYSRDPDVHSALGAWLRAEGRRVVVVFDSRRRLYAVTLQEEDGGRAVGWSRQSQFEEAVAWALYAAIVQEGKSAKKQTMR